MQKNSNNNVSGHDYFVARQTIGLSVSKVADMTQLNRNKLADFEKEKGVLSTADKRALKKFYEDRGYDFGEPDELDHNQIGDDYKAVHIEFMDSTQNSMPNEVGDALISLVDAQHDVLACADYLSGLNLDLSEPNPSTIDNRPLICKQLDQQLIAHFEADKKGQFKDKGGLLGGSAQWRGQKLVSVLAYNKLCELAALNPHLFDLSIGKAVKQTDNKRMLEELSDLLQHKEVEEFRHVTSDAVK
ncbi:hypothetical protein RJD39_22105 [Vibrio scophthalmi]|uniref:Uncharacterized protein n=1 Tax=Vibrio scophthalmi TaxID=45658 RepID=A0A1E3WFY1_9VIBR|nr:hypothetical protein [Vibrio scophthalmi]ODS04723.1 hypothetical protein VSF3289_03862 [Vibrio scophthalmi]ODS04731.1 hypothetical protein VSF3289_03870 [Vibrio scophthalmi]